ncbi:hypothetical protein MVG78_01385 [Roseomonas gilardii subsp. gilardii]|uniref:hypothetical protein n=1 Tax=Roseomonas gilardii TaxID=257708 RepID=UPI001FFA174B|nr:hypothetical protein [Roseomonas gilardii]UPG72880.1 hypothetical protein MVG78_01385 [Roseomonas gilardii subsp. gilardii]
MLAQKDIDLATLNGWNGSLTLVFELDDDVEGLETRLFCQEGCAGAIEALEIHEERS